MTIQEVLREMRSTENFTFQEKVDVHRWANAIEDAMGDPVMRMVWERDAEIVRLTSWQPAATAPGETYVIVLWGSNAAGPEGVEIAERKDGYWITHGGERIDADGYRVLGWMPLPEKPTAPAGKEDK